MIKKYSCFLFFFLILPISTGLSPVFGHEKSDSADKIDEIIEEVEIQKVDRKAEESSPALLKLVGKLHPMIVHFPIAFIILCMAILLLRPFFKIFNFDLVKDSFGHFFLFLLVFSVLACLGAVATGFVLGKEILSSNPQFEEILERHEFFAFAATGFVVIATLLKYLSNGHSSNRIFPVLFILALLLATVLVGITGHFGAMMVHGENYFSF